eukprot:5592255-Heterocapsa_arctica.AAC.1
MDVASVSSSSWVACANARSFPSSCPPGPTSTSSSIPASSAHPGVAANVGVALGSCACGLTSSVVPR